MTCFFGHRGRNFHHHLHPGARHPDLRPPRSAGVAVAGGSARAQRTAPAGCHESRAGKVWPAEHAGFALPASPSAAPGHTRVPPCSLMGQVDPRPSRSVWQRVDHLMLAGDMTQIMLCGTRLVRSTKQPQYVPCCAIALPSSMQWQGRLHTPGLVILTCLKCQNSKAWEPC